MFKTLSYYYEFNESEPEAKIYYNCYKNLSKIKLNSLELEDNLNLKNIFNLINLDPEEANSWINQAFIFERFNRYDQAIKCYKNALLVNPIDCSILTYQSEAYEKLNNYKLALLCLKEAIKLSPNNSELWIKKWKMIINNMRFKNLEIKEFKENLDQSDFNALSKMVRNLGLTLIISSLRLIIRQEPPSEKKTLRCKNCGMKYRKMVGLIQNLCPICSSIMIQTNDVEKSEEETQISRIV